MLTALCNDPITLALLRSASFTSAKRPFTKALLQRIDLAAILMRTDRRRLTRGASDIQERELASRRPSQAISNAIVEFERAIRNRVSRSPETGTGIDPGPGGTFDHETHAESSGGSMLPGVDALPAAPRQAEPSKKLRSRAEAQDAEHPAGHERRPAVAGSVRRRRRGALEQRRTAEWPMPSAAQE